jgi:hypothetical protein
VTRTIAIAKLGPIVAILLVAGRHPGHAVDANMHGQDAAARPIQAVQPSPANGSTDAKLRDAAEPFETLTETAFTASRAALGKMVADAMVAARSAQTLLPDQSTKRFGDEMAALKAAYRHDRRAAIALSSIEVYRILVTAVGDGAKVPAGVSLLDYAAYRYRADLKTNPRRWPDMADAVGFARQTWTVLMPKVGSPALEAQVLSAITAMEQAAGRKDASAAAKAAQTQLDLVDDLEKHFASR